MKRKKKCQTIGDCLLKLGIKPEEIEKALQSLSDKIKESKKE